LFRYQERFPYYDIVPHPERKTVMFKHDEDTVYTVEELIAMLLEYAKLIDQDFTDQKIKDTVITIPVYFSQVRYLAVYVKFSFSILTISVIVSISFVVCSAKKQSFLCM